MTDYLVITMHGGVLDSVMKAKDEDTANNAWRKFYRDLGEDMTEEDTPDSTRGDFSHFEDDCHVVAPFDIHDVPPPA
jgi:hypothetical protein